MEFKYSCQVLRQTKLDEDIDSIIVYYYLEVDKRAEDYYSGTTQKEKDEEIQKILANTPISFTDLDKKGLPVKFVRN